MEDRSKIAVACFIRDRKEVLFNKFKSTLRNEKKIKAWQEVVEYAKACEVTTLDKDCQHFRDVTWANWKRRVQAKFDQSKKTGGAGVEFTEFENIILDIIGRNSPVLVGLGVQGSTGRNHVEENLTETVNPDFVFTEEEVAAATSPKKKRCSKEDTKLLLAEKRMKLSEIEELNLHLKTRLLCQKQGLKVPESTIDFLQKFFPDLDD